MILQRYLLREILKPLAAVLGVLVVLFTSYGAARFLSHAVNGLLPTDMIFQLVGLRTLIALEVLIPISLYFAVVLAFGRMYGDSEFTAMSAMGLSPARVMGTVALLSSCTALGVAGLSLMVRPWAYRSSHELSNAAAASLSTNAMEAGTFYVGNRGNRTLFIEHRAGPGAIAHNVFVQLKRPDGTRIIYARTARQMAPAGPDNGAQMQLTDAHVYAIPHGPDGDGFIMHVKDLVVQLASPRIEPPGYSSVAAGTAYLAGSSSAPDIAEFEWRLSTSVSTLLLGMMGVPLARSRPREHKYAKMGIAILIYAGYYLFYESARTWVQNGVIPALPGLWWAPGLLAAVLIGAWLAPRLARRRRRA
ncbi:MAG: LPS export ABC transporter permease LptF [Steroidobacteraceae bacterium]